MVATGTDKPTRGLAALLTWEAHRANLFGVDLGIGHSAVQYVPPHPDTPDPPSHLLLTTDQKPLNIIYHSAEPHAFS